MIIAVIKGRIIDVSAAGTFNECATIMQALGATDVLNLDGGGAATMVADNMVVNHPSNTTPRGDGFETFLRANL